MYSDLDSVSLSTAYETFKMAVSVVISHLSLDRTACKKDGDRIEIPSEIKRCTDIEPFNKKLQKFLFDKIKNCITYVFRDLREL